MASPLDILSKKANVLNHFDESAKKSNIKIEKAENPNDTTMEKSLKKVGTTVLSLLPDPKEKEDVEESAPEPEPNIIENVPSVFVQAEKKYTIDSHDYFYLHDNKQLQNDIASVIGKGKPKKWTLYFCLFRVNDGCKEPFVEYLMEKNQSAKYHFPSLSLEESDIPTDSDKIQEWFETRCDENVKSQVPTADSLRANYCGFLENDEEGSDEDCLFVFYDMTHIDFQMPTETQQWAIMDEILNERKVLGIEIENTVFTFFHLHPVLISLTNNTGDRVSLPICLYLCEIADSDASLGEHDLEYRNIAYSSTETKNSAKSLVRNSIEHDVFGNVFVFSMYPLVENELVKRFAVFVGEPLYIFNKTTPLRKIKSIQPGKHHERYNPTDNYLSIYFFENQHPLWCLRSGEQFTEI
jgi:hypothetical protein